MGAEDYLVKSFQKVFEQINKEGIKESVDKNGIDKFISDCALLAGMTGAASGFGGFTTMFVGVPVDVLNNIIQQFRVTLAVIYDKKGVYQISFLQFMKIVGVSVGVEIGVTITKSIMINIANKILIMLSAKTAAKAVPFLGAFIGGGGNYLFVKGIGEAVKKIDMSNISFE
jgi:hypothetical protein